MKIEIVNPLVLKPLPMPKTTWYQRGFRRVKVWAPRPTREFSLYEPFVFKMGKDVLISPEGSVINGASIPSILWSWLGNPVEWFLEWSAVHDPGYSGTLQWMTVAECGGQVIKKYTKEDLDNLVRVMGPHFNIPPAKVAVAYRGVHLFGQGAFDQARKRAA